MYIFKTDLRVESNSQRAQNLCVSVAQSDLKYAVKRTNPRHKNEAQNCTVNRALNEQYSATALAPTTKHQYHAKSQPGIEDLFHMAKLTRFLTTTLLLIGMSAQHLYAEGNPGAIIHTSMGDIQLELFADTAPVSVENFIAYAKSGAYDETIFHRVISHFMIQGGGFTADMKKKPTREPIINEANNGLSNTRGTISMARTNDPHSATSQFFINTQDNINLNYSGEGSSRNWGYAVFGRVTAGMEVVDDIRFVETTTRDGYNDVPVVPVVINSIEIIDS